MDKMVFLAAQGAKAAIARQDNVATNLANADTDGFRAQVLSFRSTPIEGINGSDVRVHGVDSLVGYNFNPGPIKTTDRDLDLAIDGPGFFSVRRPDGTEGYTRSGSFQIDQDGFLVSNSGLFILDEAGAEIQAPENTRVSFTRDGQFVSLDAEGNLVEQIARLKTVSPDPTQIEKAPDGLFVQKNGQAAAFNEFVVTVPAAIEGSNSNLSELMVQMIEAQRSFEHNMKIISTSDTNAQAANNLYSI